MWSKFEVSSSLVQKLLIVSSFLAISPHCVLLKLSVAWSTNQGAGKFEIHKKTFSNKIVLKVTILLHSWFLYIKTAYAVYHFYIKQWIVEIFLKYETLKVGFLKTQWWWATHITFPSLLNFYCFLLTKNICHIADTFAYFTMQENYHVLFYKRNYTYNFV